MDSVFDWMEVRTRWKVCSTITVIQILESDIQPDSLRPSCKLNQIVRPKLVSRIHVAILWTSSDVAHDEIWTFNDEKERPIRNS